MTLVAKRETQSAQTKPAFDAQVHLNRLLQERLLAGEMEGLPEIALPHLIDCPTCRALLRRELEMANAPAEHPAYALLEDAETSARWTAAARTAAEAACRELTEQGIGYVYGRDDKVYRRLPDGEEELVTLAQPLVS